MDINENYREQLMAAESILHGWDQEGGTICEGEAVRLAELVVAFHEWIKKGGALPSALQK